MDVDAPLLRDCPLSYTADAIHSSMPRALRNVNDLPKPVRVIPRLQHFPSAATTAIARAASQRQRRVSLPFMVPTPPAARSSRRASITHVPSALDGAPSRLASLQSLPPDVVEPSAKDSQRPRRASLPLLDASHHETAEKPRRSFLSLFRGARELDSAPELKRAETPQERHDEELQLQPPPLAQQPPYPMGPRSAISSVGRGGPPVAHGGRPSVADTAVFFRGHAFEFAEDDKGVRSA